MDSYASFRAIQKSFKTRDGVIKFIDKGKGQAILLMHGIPTSGWLYRKMIPILIANDIEWVEVNNPVKVYLSISQNILELIPLNNNRFALIDSLGNLVRGNKKDFVRLTEKANGFVEIVDEQ